MLCSCITRVGIHIVNFNVSPCNDVDSQSERWGDKETTRFCNDSHSHSFRKVCIQCGAKHSNNLHNKKSRIHQPVVTDRLYTGNYLIKLKIWNVIISLNLRCETAIATARSAYYILDWTLDTIQIRHLNSSSHCSLVWTFKCSGIDVTQHSSHYSVNSQQEIRSRHCPMRLYSTYS